MVQLLYETRCWGLDDFDGIEHLFQVQMPADRGLLQSIQCFAELHDIGPESISQNLGWTHLHEFCQWGTHERVRDVQAVHDTYYALLRMRPLSISCAEGCVVISCEKVDYDKSGWRDD
jgi:hypothetical protein